MIGPPLYPGASLSNNNLNKGHRYFFASAHFLYQISIFQSSFLVYRLLLFICKRTSVLGVRYLFTKDCGPSLPVLYTGCCPCYPFCLQRTVILVFRYSFAKDRCPCLLLFICKGLLSLSFGYSFSKDFCPCLVLFTFKGPRSLSSAIHLQKTAVLV